MKQELAHKFITALGLERVKNNGEWVSASCPLSPWTHTHGSDRNPSFAINFKGEGYFNCFSCESGDLYELLRLLKKYGADVDYKSALDALNQYNEGDIEVVFKMKGNDEDQIWNDSYLDNFHLASLNEKAFSYLVSRKVGRSLIDNFEIMWDARMQSVCFPIRNIAGLLTGMRGRLLTGRYHDYDNGKNQRNPLVWYGEDKVDFNLPVLMVEGVFDFMAVYPHYNNVVSPLSVGIGKEKALRMKNAHVIYTLFDNDMGGDKGRRQIDKYLGGRQITHLSTGFYNDPGEMPAHDIKQVIAQI